MMKRAEPNKSHAVAGIVIADHLLICVVAFPNDRQFVQINSAALQLLYRLIRFRMRAIHRDN
jgi:hypothetical protein